MDTIQNQTQKSTTEKSIEDTEIENLDKKRKELSQRTKQIPDSWHEAKIVILFKKGDPKDIKSYRPISLLSHSYKIFTRLLQTRIERTLDENQPREKQASEKAILQQTICKP